MEKEVKLSKMEIKKDVEIISGKKPNTLIVKEINEGNELLNYRE